MAESIAGTPRIPISSTPFEESKMMSKKIKMIKCDGPSMMAIGLIPLVFGIGCKQHEPVQTKTKAVEPTEEAVVLSIFEKKSISFSGDGKSKIETDEFNVDCDSEIFVLWECESYFDFSLNQHQSAVTPTNDLGIGLEKFKVKRGKHSFIVPHFGAPWTIRVWTSFDDLIADKEFGKPEIVKMLINQGRIWSAIDRQLMDLKNSKKDKYE